MDLLEHESSAGPQDTHLLRDMAPDFFRGAMGEDIPSVAAASPEGDVTAEITLEARGFHAPGVDLHRIYSLQAGVDEVRQELPHSSAAVQHDLDFSQFLGPAPEERVEGLVETAVHLGGEQGAALPPRSSPNWTMSM